MGGCNSQHSDSLKDMGNKPDTLFYIRKNLNELEENIVKLRKEDVHYRMTRLMFLLNVMKDLTPLIRIIENNNDNLDYNSITSSFNDIFISVWKNDKNEYYSSLIHLKGVVDKKVNPALP